MAAYRAEPPALSGLDLKTLNQSWDESFNQHQFTTQQLDIMDNFHLHYECLDARDDYHAQLKQGEVILPGHNNSNYSEHDVAEQMASHVFGDDDHLDAGCAEFDIDISGIGRKEMKRRQAMEMVKEIMQGTGWTNPVLGKTPTVPFQSVRRPV